MAGGEGEEEREGAAARDGRGEGRGAHAPASLRWMERVGGVGGAFGKKRQRKASARHARNTYWFNSRMSAHRAAAATARSEAHAPSAC